ncbi:MAG: nuclear transport factor 2 family protein [Holophagaceae bacterium]
MRPLLLALGLPTLLAAQASAPADEVRAAFDRFVAAQNAHDLKAVEALLSSAPDFLWITRGAPVWGRAEALRRFEALYLGTWKLSPDPKAFRMVFARPGVAQLYVPITFSIGAAGQPPVETLFHMNQTWIQEGGVWRLASILPIPASPNPVK